MPPLLTKREVWSTWRFEHKYRIPALQYYQIRNAMTPHMEPDEFTVDQGEYLVRSLYFDTDRYQAYHEKINGDFGRIKIRVRSYAATHREDAPLRVELKTRRGAAMEKFSSFVPLSSYQAFMETGHWPEHEDSSVLTEFARLYHLRTLRPKLLIQYQREGLVSRRREDLRITFDHHVESCSATEIFPAHTYFRPHHPETVILEIKCKNDQPVWLSRLVRQHGLKLVASSKYAMGVEISRPDVVTPMWSQGYTDPPDKALAMFELKRKQNQ